MHLRTICLLFVLAFLTFACSSSTENTSPSPTLATGVWRATLALQGETLPFTFDLMESDSSNYELYLRNAGERLLVDEITLDGDSIRIPMHIFDTEIVAKNEGDHWTGYWTKNYAENYTIPFEAQQGEDYRFELTSSENPVDMSGKWAVTFEDDSLPAVGVFEQSGSHLTGSFLTTTGDYRFLEGDVSGSPTYAEHLRWRTCLFIQSPTSG